jgi:TonB family protein
MKRDWWLAAMAALLMSPGMAQTAKPKEDAAAAEAAAAMERARRQAANPMRIILEAAKGKRRSGVDDTPAPAPDSSVRPVVNRSATAPVAAAATPAPEATPRVAAPAAPAAVAAAAPAPVAAAPAPAPEPVVTEITLTSEVVQAKAAAPVPALVPTAAATVSAAAVAPPPVALPALEVAQAPPRLLSMVEPDLPPRMLDELGRNATVAVDITIRPDGTVGDITVARASPRGLQRLLAAAVEQWRFAPLPAARQHRVELVFNAER